MHFNEHWCREKQNKAMRRKTTGGETSKRYVNHRLTAAYLEADDDDEYDDARGRRSYAAAEVSADESSGCVFCIFSLSCTSPPVAGIQPPARGWILSYSAVTDLTPALHVSCAVMVAPLCEFRAPSSE